MAVHSLQIPGEIHIRNHRVILSLEIGNSHFPAQQLDTPVLEHLFPVHDWIRR
jgi:hypothetical protein